MKTNDYSPVGVNRFCQFTSICKPISVFLICYKCVILWVPFWTSCNNISQLPSLINILNKIFGLCFLFLWKSWPYSFLKCICQHYHHYYFSFIHPFIRNIAKWSVCPEHWSLPQFLQYFSCEEIGIRFLKGTFVSQYFRHTSFPEDLASFRYRHGLWALS